MKIHSVKEQRRQTTERTEQLLWSHGLSRHLLTYIANKIQQTSIHIHSKQNSLQIKVSFHWVLIELSKPLPQKQVNKYVCFRSTSEVLKKNTTISTASHLTFHYTLINMVSNCQSGCTLILVQLVFETYYSFLFSILPMKVLIPNTWNYKTHPSLSKALQFKFIISPNSKIFLLYQQSTVYINTTAI